MATTVTLDTGSVDITMPAPAPTGREPARYPQITGVCWGGGIKVFDMGDGSTQWDATEIHWAELTQAEYSTLRTFILTTINRSETAFTYTDQNSTDHTNMHYVEGIDDFEEDSGNLWSGTIRLHKDMSA